MVLFADTLEDLQAELDGYYEEMKTLGELPDVVFLKLAAWSARASEIRSRCVRQESRKMQAFRTREIDPFLEEVDRQYRFYSRIVSVRGQEIQLEGNRNVI